MDSKKKSIQNEEAKINGRTKKTNAKIQLP